MGQFSAKTRREAQKIVAERGYIQMLAPDEQLAVADERQYEEFFKTDVETTDEKRKEAEMEAEEYKYYMNARPMSIGTTPKDFLRFDESDKGGRYGAVYYKRQLNRQEIYEYELVSAAKAEIVNRLEEINESVQRMKGEWSEEKIEVIQAYIEMALEMAKQKGAK